MSLDYDDMTDDELAALRGDEFSEDEDELDETEESNEDVEDTDEDAVEDEEDNEPQEDPRLTRLLEQVEASRERNAWLEEQLGKLIAKETAKEEKIEVKPVYDFEAKEEEYINLIVDGEIAKASKLRSDIDRAKTEALLAAIKGETEAAKKTSVEEAKQLIENERFSKAVETMEERYPFLNPEHKSYNEEAVDTANSIMNSLIAKGLSRVEALKKAVDRVTPLYSREVEKKALGSERKSTAGKVAADAANRQPPKTSGVKGTTNSPSTKPLSKYTDKEFASLSAAELRALRGDM